MFNYYVYRNRIDYKEGDPIAGFERLDDAKRFVKTFDSSLLAPFDDLIIVEIEIKENIVEEKIK